MKRLFFYLFVSILPGFVFGQSKTNPVDSNTTYLNLIYTDQINGINVLASDTFNQIVQKRLQQSKSFVGDSTDHPKAYFTNIKGDKYLKIFGGPDLGYGWFYSVGYTSHSKCKDCGRYIGKEDVTDYVVNNGIKLGDNIKLVWAKAHLNYFRKFTLEGAVYFYFEKGIKHEIPFTPNQLFYYKFKDDTLIEMGFGYGMIGVNPMLHPE